MPTRVTRPSSNGVRVIEIAELLGVSKQRAHQIADEPGFPTPVGREGQSRLWNRREVTAWRSSGGGRSPGADREEGADLL
jgi:predicted DNA-binding transcriptional regulator AlpA